MFNGEKIEVEISYENVVLKLEIDKKGRLTRYLQQEGPQKIIKSSDGEIGGKWEEHAPFISHNYETTDEDWNYMKKIVERIILETI